MECPVLVEILRSTQEELRRCSTEEKIKKNVQEEFESDKHKV